MGGRLPLRFLRGELCDLCEVLGVSSYEKSAERVAAMNSQILV